MPLELKGATSGGITLTAESVAGTNTITLPAATGTAVVNGANSAIVSASSQASTSGTSIDFTSIPSWVKRITVMFNGVSTNGSSPVQIQLGDSGGVETSGYLGATGISQNGGTAGGALSAGFLIDGNTTQAATSVRYGLCTIANITGNAWVAHGAVGETTNSRVQHVAGAKSLSATLDRVRITTVNGTDTFDAGTINIMYE